MNTLRHMIAVMAMTASIISAFPFTLPSHDDVEKALDYQIKNYPESHLADVYKNFFQDYFGPGHILSNLSASKDYLDRELADTTAFEGPLFEPTGAMGNFIRLNLSVIHDGKVPYDLYFSKFADSVNGIDPPSADQWIETWNFIDSVIKEKGLTFKDEENDRERIKEKMKTHDFVMHHSDDYNNAYHFRYRIFSREIFEKEILPLIKEQMQ